MHEHAKKCVEMIMATGSKDEIAKMTYDLLIVKFNYSTSVLRSTDVISFIYPRLSVRD